MRITYVLLTLFIASLSFTSCKTEFERIRASGDFDNIYKRAFEYYEQGEYLKAQTLFEIVINNLRGKVESEKVYFHYAYTHYYIQKYILASYYFKNFANTFPNSEYREEADFMTGYSYHKLSPSYRLDQTYTTQAIESFQRFANTYPNSERTTECNRLIDEMRAKLEKKAFSQGKLYYDLRHYEAAVQCFENLLKDFPETGSNEEVRYLIARSHFQFAENSLITKQADRFEAAAAAAAKFLARHSDSPYAAEVKDIQQKSDKKLKTLANVRY